MSQPNIPRPIDRIVILTLDSLHCAIALPVLLKHFRGRVVCICRSRRFGGRYGSFLRQLERNYKRSGFDFVMFVGLQLLLFRPMSHLADRINRLLGWPKRVFPVRELARLYGTPVISTHDPNSDAVVAQIQAFRPDLILSFYFDHVVKQPLIDLPAAGVINVHTGILPDNRGPFPNIWAVINGCAEVGASIHYINDERLDAGPIIKVERIKRDANESVLALDCRLVRLAAGLAIDAIADIESGAVHAQVQDENAGAYYSYPTRQDLRRFRRRGGCLYRVSDFVRPFFNQ